MVMFNQQAMPNTQQTPKEYQTISGLAGILQHVESGKKLTKAQVAWLRDHVFTQEGTNLDMPIIRAAFELSLTAIGALTRRQIPVQFSCYLYACKKQIQQCNETYGYVMRAYATNAFNIAAATELINMALLLEQMQPILAYLADTLPVSR